jgi:hypothetical protein
MQGHPGEVLANVERFMKLCTNFADRSLSEMGRLSEWLSLCTLGMIQISPLRQ